MTPACNSRPNGYMGQLDCGAHGTPWPCEVTEESWAKYVRTQTVDKWDLSE